VIRFKKSGVIATQILNIGVKLKGRKRSLSRKKDPNALWH